MPRDDLIFQNAVFYAQRRAYWRALANNPARPGHLTRRQCLGHARWNENRIVNLAIQAEQRCLREVSECTAAPVTVNLVASGALVGSVATSAAGAAALRQLVASLA